MSQKKYQHAGVEFASMHPSHGGFILELVDPGKFFICLRPPRVSPLDRRFAEWQLIVNVNVRFVLLCADECWWVRKLCASYSPSGGRSQRCV